MGSWDEERTMPRERPTLAQVAEQSGYAASTVSLVLNDRPGTRISQEARDKIRAAADALGYAPDPGARGLRTGRTDAVGFVSDEVTVTRFASSMVTGAVEAVQQDGHVLIISEVGVGNLETQGAVDVLLDRRVDALVVGLMRARQVRVPRSAGRIATVVANGVGKWDSPAQFQDSPPALGSVLPDEYSAGRKAVDYLVASGHTSIALIGRHPAHLDPEVSVTIPARFAGMDEAMAAAGLKFVADESVREWEPAGGRRALREILKVASPTAVICANDRMAFGVYQEAVRKGLRIGVDLSVISFDDEALASYLEPGLTTIRIPYREMGEIAVRMAKSGRLRDELIPMPLVERHSVAFLEV